MVFAEGGELGTEEEGFEDLVTEFRRESEERGGNWIHCWGNTRLMAVKDVSL